MSNSVVVLSTYNGSKWVVEQLDSLLSQTLLPEAIIISDDCSTDYTVPLIVDYLQEHNGYPVSVSLSVNSHNQGWRANFRNLIISAANEGADYIFPCDQDDIWEPEKIQDMVSVMEAHADIDVLTCSVEPMYEEGAQHTGADTSESPDSLHHIRHPAFGPQFIYVKRPGCTYCVRGSFVKRIARYWPSSSPHDQVLWSYSLLYGSLGLLDERLVRFRRHSGNASARKLITWVDRFKGVQQYRRLAKEMISLCQNGWSISSDNLYLLNDFDEWLQQRENLLSGKNRIRNAISVTRGIRFYAFRRSWAKDLALAFFRNARL